MLDKNTTKIPMLFKIVFLVQIVLIVLLFDLVNQNKDEIQSLKSDLRSVNSKINIHQHDNDFASSDHNHDFEYSNYRHSHSEYSYEYHDHDYDYSKKSHNHYFDY